MEAMEGMNEGERKDYIMKLLTVYVPEGVEEKVREIKDREYLHNLIKRLVSTEDVLGLLREELNLEL